MRDVDRAVYDGVVSRVEDGKFCNRYTVKSGPNRRTLSSSQRAPSLRPEVYEATAVPPLQLRCDRSCRAQTSVHADDRALVDPNQTRRFIPTCALRRVATP